MEINPSELAGRAMYKILTSTVAPRPIGWISTVDQEGRANLAPFSYFTVICEDPPHLLFCPGIRSTDGGIKDTLANVRATGEFVANIVSEALAEAMNQTSVEVAHEVDEFELAGVTKAPSVMVRPPRVAESPVNYECVVAHIYDVGDQPGAGSVVIGRVAHLHLDDDIVGENYRINLERLKPIGRLVASGYCRITDQFEMIRPPSQLRKE